MKPSSLVVECAVFRLEDLGYLDASLEFDLVLLL